MARKTTVVLVDDLDGSKAVETVSFALDGVTYEIDLSARNAAALRKSMARYVTKGRRTGGRRSAGGAARATAAPSRKRARASKSGRDIPAIREWAKAQGLLASERGRIPASVLEAYDKAH